MIIKRHLYWIIVILFFATCARQTSPTGGPKDTIPPKLVSSNPAHKSLNFKGRSIDLTFTEFITLNNPKEQLLITPSPGKEYDVTSKRNTVTVEFEKELLPNTTYVLNFRETVQDITEKNPSPNLVLAISTGSYLDSLSIEGKAIDLLKGTELTDITVAITPQNDTFNIFKHPAQYFTKTNEKGLFKLDYLRPDTYSVYAIDDKNKNRIADTRTESYGFLSIPLVLTSDTSKIEIAIIRLDARPLKLTSARPYNTYFNIKTSKNLQGFSLRTQDTTQQLYYSYGEDQSNIKLFNTFQAADSVAISLNAYDSIGNTLDTVIYAKFPVREVAKEKFTASVTDYRILSESSTLEASFTFNKPIATVNFDSLYFRHDSLSIKTFTQENITWNDTRTAAKLKATLEKSWFKTEETTSQAGRPNRAAATQTQPQPDTLPQLKVLNELIARPATFISIEQDTTKAITQSIMPQKPEDLSMFLYEIKTSNQNIIVQLLDKQLKVLQEKFNMPKGQFENVVPADYSIRVILDANGNKRWDPGNYLRNIEPEKVFYVKTEDGKTVVNIKANWEFDFPPLLITP